MTSLLKYLRKEGRISERRLAAELGLARDTIRAAEQAPRQTKLGTLEKVARYWNRQTLISIVPVEDCRSDFSTVAVSQWVQQDGFDSWKIHFMNFVDEFRRQQDIRLALLPPVKSLDDRLLALLAAIVCNLCHEMSLDAPAWASKVYFLPEPWFVSGMESLKAMSLLESPPFFRKNNIFVLENFLARA